jgi:hypothetical protein
MGAQSFPPHMSQIVADNPGCIRVTYRMMPEVRVLAQELELYAQGDPNFEKTNIEDTRAKSYEGTPRAKGSYFRNIVGGIPDVVYFQVGCVTIL